MENPSAAIKRAVRLIASHGRVERIEANIEVDGSIIAYISTGLPNRWRARGRSDNGVLAVEPIRFQFSERYPFVAPDVTLRSDFDRSHPHLMPGPTSELPRPCYYEGSARDLLRMRGPQGIVDQLADWLEKAAMAKLIDPIQGWEPVRRDHIDDYIEIDADMIRDHITANGGGAYYYAPFSTVANGPNWRCYCSHFLNEATLKSGTIDWLHQKFGQAGIGIVVWPGRAPSGGPFVSDRYLPEAVSNVAELFAHAKAIGVGDQLRANMTLLRQRLKSSASKDLILVSIVLLARRPLDVIGQGSAVELLPYIIEVGAPSNLEETSDHPVRLACQRDVISKKLLQKMSGADVEDARAWTLIGAGSVGSKIALHLAREGMGPSFVIDKSFLRPHNFARHALLPFGRGEGFQDVKAKALIDAIGQLGQTAQGRFSDIIDICTSATEEERNKLWPVGTEVIVDATGSPTVTDVMCLSDVVKSRPRAVETSLMGGGGIGYFSLEGPGCNPNLQDLAAETYRIVARNDKLSTAAFGVEGQRIEIGQGCSTLTAQMSDATLSATIPAMAMQLSTLLRNGLPSDSGEVLLGCVEDDLLGQRWERHPVRPFTVIRGASPEMPSVRVSTYVAAIIDDAIAKKPGLETGGILMGRYNETTNTFHVVDTIAPPPDSQFSAALFLLGIKGLTEVIQGYINRAHGTLFPVGTWHNHLADSPASKTDLISGLQIAFAQTFPALLLIRTPSKFRGLVIETLDQTRSPSVDTATVVPIEEVE